MNTNYYRITGYCKERDICFILDCNGLFDKLWQFSSYLLQKGLQILEVGSEEKFLDVNIGKVEADTEKIYLRAIAKGNPEYITQPIDGVTCKAIQVADKIYVPDKTRTV